LAVLPCPTPLLTYVQGDTWRECHRAVCLAERNIPQCINICGSSTGGPLVLSVVIFTTPTHGRLQSLFNARTGSVIEAQKTTNSRHFPNSVLPEGTPSVCAAILVLHPLLERNHSSIPPPREIRKYGPTIDGDDQERRLPKPSVHCSSILSERLPLPNVSCTLWRFAY